MTTKTVFKVVKQRLDGVMTSTYARGKYLAYYEIGKVTFPHKGYLYAFEDPKEAREFASWGWQCVVLRCDAIVTRHKYIRFCLDKAKYDSFWEFPRSDQWPTISSSACYCKWIKPLEVA